LGDLSLNKKILIVDDEAFIRLLLEQTLEDLEEQGVDLLTVDNGADALGLIRDEKPQLVFLDVMLPRMNGFDVCRAVRRDLQEQDTYIVLLTAKGQAYDRQTGEEAGANIYMTKPFDPDEVLDLAKKILGV
jgi:two-component system alkaline phosphatase synthesis response regulator PhoP